MTLLEALAQARERLGDDTDASFEAEVLLAHVLGRDRGYLVAHREDPMEPDHRAAYESLVERRAAGEPVAYLLGEREFYGLSFRVGPQVLIPRPETELLVDRALELLPRSGRLLDLGTGSGAIAIAVARHCAHCSVVATDISERALALARANAHSLGADNVQFIRADWLEAIPGRFDVIVSNPPYVDPDDPHLRRGDPRFEPHEALATPGGLDALRTIVAGAPDRLEPGGWLLVEHGYNQAEAVTALLREAGLEDVRSENDLSGQPRMGRGRRPRC